MNEPLQPEEDRLEQLLSSTVRTLPARRAPHTLESRVLEELARRASQPWWRRSFRQWPTVARASFVAACGALVGITLLGGSWMLAGIPSLQESDALSNAWLRQAAAITGAVGNLTASLVQVIPPAWFYLGLAAAALLYAFLFGLGAAAYRLLYLQPLNGR
jgi:hypothetical protein